MISLQTLPVRVRDNRIYVGERFSLSLQRTLRVPDDGRTYPLPPGLGRFPIHAVPDYRDRVPEAWRGTGGFFVPAYQREALWIGFDAAPWKPNVVKIGTGQVNAVSGGQWDQALHAAPQDYLVCPPQLWLDGINAGHEFVRQFVAIPLGLGYTVEAQVSGAESHGGVQILVYEPKPGRFPDEAPPASQPQTQVRMGWRQSPGGAMGLGAGGKMTQKIHPDPYGIDVWDQEAVGAAVVHLVNTEQYRAITGQDPPSTPIDAHTYTAHGLPWFELYDERRADLAPTDALSRVKSVEEMARQKGSPLSGDESIAVQAHQIKPLGADPD